MIHHIDAQVVIQQAEEVHVIHKHVVVKQVHHMVHGVDGEHVLRHVEQELKQEQDHIQ